VTSKPDFKVMVLLLVFMQLTRDLFAIAKFLLILTPSSQEVMVFSLFVHFCWLVCLFICLSRKIIKRFS